MNQIRVALNKLPPGPTIKLLRKIFSLPAPAARKILHQITKPRSSHKPWIHKVRWNNEWSGCWIGENVRKLDNASLMKRIRDCDIVLFNVHGGGFRVGTCTMFMDSWIEWVKTLKNGFGIEAMVMSVDYRLAPEYKYPNPVEDVVRAYESLTKTLSIDPEKIVVTGDSVGVSLILEMLFITHDPSLFEIVTDGNTNTPCLSKLPRPAGAVFSSPLVTEETTSESWQRNVKYDYISQYTAKLIKKDYFEPLGPDSPPNENRVLGIAKLETGFKDFLPERVLMFLGNKEVMRDDALDLAMRAENDGVHWETVIEDCVHDWFCVREVVKDKTMLARADNTFAEFCYQCIRHVPHKTVIAPMAGRSSNNNGIKALYENSDVTDTSGFSYKRSSEGLEIVIEEDEEGDFKEAESYDSDFSDTDLESAVTATAVIISSMPALKQNPRTVFI